MPEKSIVRTESRPGSVQGAPYSQAIVARGSCSSPASGARAGREGVRRHDRRADRTGLRQPRGDPGCGGGDLDRLVKTTVFLTDLGDFAGMNEVYARHVVERPPARSTVEIAGLPSGALVEIEAIATVSE